MAGQGADGFGLGCDKQNYCTMEGSSVYNYITIMFLYLSHSNSRHYYSSSMMT